MTFLKEIHFFEFSVTGTAALQNQVYIQKGHHALTKLTEIIVGNPIHISVPFPPVYS